MLFLLRRYADFLPRMSLCCFLLPLFFAVDFLIIIIFRHACRYADA